jgi:3-dehydroquinate synthase
MLQNIKQIKIQDLLAVIPKYDVLVVDKKVWELYQDRLQIDEDKIVLVNEPEYEKSYKGYENLIDVLLEKKINRKSKLLAIGGGALSDLAGFVAATVLRGIEWSVVPTTLLSMVDAAIGGKVGINHKKGKNLVGAFYQPENIYIATEFLETLADEHVVSGKGEICKYGLLSQQIYSMIMHDASLGTVIFACAQFKKDIVEQDFKEGARRKLLNLGHTLGHAYEKLYQIPHGLAVTIGMQAIVKIYNPYFSMQLDGLIAKLDLITPKLNEKKFEDFWGYVLLDKKRTNKDELEIIVPKNIGHVEIERVNLNQFRNDIIANEYFKNLN